MSANIKQVYDANPITSNASTDLMYFGQSPYGTGNDAAMLYSDFAAQFAGSSQIPSGTTGQLVYYAADGNTLTPLNLGLQFTITGGDLMLANAPSKTLLGNSTATTGGITDVPFSTFLQAANNLSDVASIPTAQTNLGLVFATGSTLTIGGSVTFSGAHTFTGTLTGDTSVTFPTSGTLATTSQIPSVPISLANGGTGANLTAANNTVFMINNTGTSILSTLGQGLALSTSTLTVGGANNIPFNDHKGIQDANGNSVLTFAGIASAVNYVEIGNQATGNGPSVGAIGSDTNIILVLNGKGTGGASIEGSKGAVEPAAGYVGETISSNVLVGSAVSLTTNVGANITSISLTAGDWDIWATGIVSPASGTITQSSNLAISTTSATLPTFPNNGGAMTAPSAAASNPVGLFCQMRLNISSTTTVYLVGQVAFTVSTCKMYGFIGARRRR
jgi:hypothetical protein